MFKLYPIVAMILFFVAANYVFFRFTKIWNFREFQFCPTRFCAQMFRNILFQVYENAHMMENMVITADESKKA